MGFDNECILNIQSLAGEYFCPVCRQLVYPNEAIQTQCTHLYCKPCLTYIVSTTRACPYDGYLVTEADAKPLIEANKAVAEAIGRVLVHCLYHRSGCTWQGPFSECTTHCTGCAYGNSPVVCNRCGTQIVHRQVQEHAQNCPGTQPLAQLQDSSQAQGFTVQSQAAQATNPQQVAPTGTPVASQAPPSQTTAPAGQNQSNPNVQPQAVAQAVVQPHAQAGQTPTPEQLYQQYQQYYQQYPQYDQHQQHLQQYGQYQQQAHHPFPSHLQVHAQAYPQQVVQAQPQPQPYLQTPAQAQAQPLHHAQLQMAAHATPQPQMHSQVNPQLQPQHHPQQPQLQMAAHAIPQPQMQAQVNPQLQPQHHPQQPQAQMLSQGQPLAHAQMPGQQLGHPHPEAHHPHPQQQLHAQIPQQQQTQLQIQHHPQPQTHGQPQVQSQLHGQPQVQSQLHAQQQVHPHPYPHTHPQPQPHMQPPLHPQHQPQPHPLQPQIHQQPQAQAQAQAQGQPQAQPQLQHPPAEASRMAQAVTGQQSYLQARPQPNIQLQQQVAPGAPQQHPVHMHPHQQPPQHAVQPQNQYPPSQQQRPVPHQQQMMPPPQGPLQQPLHQQPHQQSQSHHHLDMQQLLPQQQPVTQPHIPPQQQPHSHHLAQPQPRPQHLSGQPSSLVHSQQHQETPFSAQQHMQPSAQSLRPQGQPTLQQHPSQVQQNIPSGRIQHPPGRPIVHNLGTPQQPFPQSSKLLQLSSSDNYLQRSNLHPQMLLQQQSDSTLQSPPPRSGSQTTLLATSAAQRAMENRLALAEKQGDFEPEKTGETFVLDAKPASHKTNGTEANDSDNRHIHGVDSAELKVSRSASVSMDAEEKAVVVNEEKNSEHPEFAVTEPSDSSKMIDKGMESKTEDDDTHEPIVKQIVKEDASEKPMEPSLSGTLVEAESKGGDGDSNSFIKHEEKNALMEVKEGHDDKVLPDAQGPQKVQSQVDGSEAGQTFPRRERPIQSILSQGQTQGIERSNIPASQQLLGGSGFDRNPLSQPPHQGFAPPHDRRLMEPAFCDRNLHQVSHQGPGPDEYRNFLPPRQEVGAIPQRNFVQSTHSVPNLDEERYQQQQIQGRGQQRPPVLLPGSNQEMRLPGPPPHFQGQQLLQLRPHGPGSVEKFPQQGPPSIAPDHFQPPPFAKQPGAPHGSFHPEAQPSGLTGMSSSSFPRGPNHLGPPQKGFEAQPIAPQGRLQGQILTPHEGGPDIPQGETLPGPPMAAPPPRAIDSAGGIMARGPFYGPEGQMGRPPMPNPMNHGDTNKRSEFFDGKQPELHQPSAFQPNAMKMNGVPGNGLVLEAPFPHVLPGERFKPFPDERFKLFPEESFKLLPEERFKPFPQDPNRRIVDRREFEEDLMRFPRPGHLDGEPKFESHFSSSRPFDRGPNPFGLDAAPKSGGSVGVAPLKAMPPYESGNLFPTNSGGSSVLPVDIGDRSTPLSLHNDNIERNARPDFLRPFPEFNQHRLDGFPPPRSPSKFGTGIGLGTQSHQLEDFNSREFLAFGEQSKSFNISDSIGNAFKGSQTPLGASESRFPVFPSSTRLGGKFGSGNLHGHSRSGDLGPDILPSHLRSGEPVGPGNFSSHFRGGEMTSTGSLPSHLRIGEQPSVGNLPSCSGEPGFGNSFPTFQGPFENDMDQSRKRNAGSMGWCRICKIDCETVEGLDLHSQTREHQKMAMDMVLLIKQDNSKKRKLSSEECTTLEDGQKSKKGSFESRGSRH